MVVEGRREESGRVTEAGEKESNDDDEIEDEKEGRKVKERLVKDGKG